METEGVAYVNIYVKLILNSTFLIISLLAFSRFEVQVMLTLYDKHD